ncbi:putative enoyl-CoA hydratase echA8 [Pseudoclavibacter triregionum]|nr:putative enoyl-CoA hydratase echA8 [Pseudoclavibacter triregionum]
MSMIELSVADGIAEVVLNAPKKLNAVDAEALRDLAQVYRDAERQGARALLLRGEGRGFCAGRDIAGVEPQNDDVLGYLDGAVTEAMRTMASVRIPTFAAVQGACLGVGLGLAIATDVVYVAENAKIGSPFANLGATLDSGGHWLFAERLGMHRTLDLIYTAELMSGAEAVAQGLFSRAVPEEELLAFTRERVARAAEGATEAFLASKDLVAEIRDKRLGMWDSISHENREQARLCSTPDYVEGFAAFNEKRKPRFTGGR